MKPWPLSLLVALAAVPICDAGERLNESQPPTSSGATARQALLDNFRRDATGMVYRWAPGDARCEPERLTALARFMYEGYDSSAWIPQTFIAAARASQQTTSAVDAIIRDRVGLVLWSQNKVAPVFGMAPNPARDRPLSWTVNCLACHMAEIDGVAYLGAGTKTLDEMILGKAAQTVTDLTQLATIRPDSIDRSTAKNAHEILRRHHHPAFDPLTRGRSTAFPASHVEMHMRAHGGAMPAADEVGRGDVKTPPLWHAVAKMPFQRWYCDGSFQGAFPLMASSMELALDQSFDKLATSVLPTIQADFKNVIQYLRPPRYPYSVDAGLAAKGQVLFNSDKLGCATCHGTYDGQGNLQWTGLHTDVGTDPARMKMVSPGFIAAFKGSPIAKEGQLSQSKGYAATPLTGVWANFPYLHNGSVPTLYHLLGPVSERPRVFSALAARKFDSAKVGQSLGLEIPVTQARDEAQLLRAHGEDRDWFNTQRTGSGNQGHDFWTRIATDENRWALIEYLKTL